MHQAGADLLKNVDERDPAAAEINTQLKDFDDCWNDIAKQVINRIQLVSQINDPSRLLNNKEVESLLQICVTQTPFCRVCGLFSGVILLSLASQ